MVFDLSKHHMEVKSIQILKQNKDQSCVCMNLYSIFSSKKHKLNIIKTTLLNRQFFSYCTCTEVMYQTSSMVKIANHLPSILERYFFHSCIVVANSILCYFSFLVLFMKLHKLFDNATRQHWIPRRSHASFYVERKSSGDV